MIQDKKSDNHFSFFHDVPDLTLEQFRRFALLVHKEAFITMKDNKITLLSNRLRKRLRALEIKSFDAYYDFLTSAQGSREELGRFLEVVTTNESYFWRTTQNFEMLTGSILPDLHEQSPGQRLDFWSAGCSTGEEPYNLTIELLEYAAQQRKINFTVTASDISERVIEFAKHGSYGGRKIEKIPPPLLERYFSPDPDHEGNYLVSKEIRRLIEFRVENLFVEHYSQQFHVIFCRNVMIYFSREDQESLAKLFHKALKPGGYLVIGHSESLHMMQTPFRSRHFPSGVAYYRSLS